MKTKRFFTALAAALTLFAAISSFAAEVGKEAPDFTLTGIDGTEHSLSDFAGKVVVLEWTNYGCPFVKKHYNSGNMQKLQSMAKDKEVVWLSICSSAPGKQGHMSASEWLETTKEKGVQSAAVLIDESGEVGRAYGAKVTPHMYVIDEEGVLAYNGAIDSIPSASISDIEKATNYVTAALEAVLSGEKVEQTMSKPYGCGIKYARDS
ncbi:thioredoxin family protein [Pelagicoccus sp. SDUM812003]|uniref:thioredoxin family protein n=1 Tax=Pelagicoccus sp. SDUM812003 TaxID=3041267 RepID=UPI00280C8774|nr:thioredoxin family protein [Pelagicoccus sp. SDUM812003]MDQ8202393.1 thioredoxin family protein [Pelagicoccus sp. SDUM812003]